MTDRARIDQFVGECLVKAAQIILVARIDKPTRPVARQGRSIWVCSWLMVSFAGAFTAVSRSRPLGDLTCVVLEQFNLQIDELLESQSELELWKRDILSPLVVEVSVLCQLAHFSATSPKAARTTGDSAHI